MHETLQSLARFMVLVILLTIPYAGIIGVVLIPGWLFACLKTRSMAPWSDFLSLFKDGFCSLVLASALLLPGVIIASTAKAFQGGLTASKGAILIQESAAGDITSILSLITFLAGIAIIPGFFQAAAARGEWKDVFSIVCLQERIARLSYLRSIACSFALVLVFFLIIAFITLAGPLFGMLEAVLATAGIAMLEALLAVMVVRQFF